MQTPSQPKSNRTMIIVAVIVVVLCCCCIVVVAGLAIAGGSITKTFSNIENGLSTPGVPDIDLMTAVPDSGGQPEATTAPDSGAAPDATTLPSFSDAIPDGGLGDDILRANTWTYVILTAAISGCEATDPKSTQIEVTQQPDASGVWVEQWTVTCADGSTKAMNVTFTPASGGGTDISVKTAP